ncbi:MBL fold metallo-hydrolase [Actinoplanes sp. NEAU-A12]|uniref:MBL fold metallo-hydrolase n=1 Tax=Actinoplanes sandaracinus TaxID=3045177 RepID=A0ABT6WXW0_9ACTN|nr:MBL fold metallo-hydrolase [Actinoplanes sandaracinus]MDI6104581.1 MBL fold metallo-hydrolase [Actinoplanes sandaracinus]
MTSTRVDFTSSAPVPGTMDVRWIHGSPSAKHNTDPDIQVHAYNEHTFILRQNKAIDYEAPFLFLLFGNDRAVLLDTGATASAEHFPIQRTVDDLTRRWLAVHPREDYELLVLHTHAHGDHTAGDTQFTGRAGTVVVGADRATAWAYLELDEPGRAGRVDLGGRMLECLATPGHHESAITFYDRYTGLLFTGDTVYPGRLYVNDWPAFRSTMDSLIRFAESRPVTHVLGCHIEMTGVPGVDYPVRTTFQPDEPPLQMTTQQLRDIRAAIDEVGDRTGRHAFADFIICYEQP